MLELLVQMFDVLIEMASIFFSTLPGLNEWMPLLMSFAGMGSALVVVALTRPAGVANGRRRRERDLESLTRPGRCCSRRVPRGLSKLEKEQAKNGVLKQQRSEADSLDSDAVALEIAALSGTMWQVSASVRTTGADLRARVAELAEMPFFEVVLMCGAELLTDEEFPLLTRPDELRGPPPQLTMLRTRMQQALTGSSDGSLRLWKVGGDEIGELSTLRGHKARVNCLVVDWVQRIALSGSSDGLLKLWDIDSKCCIDTLGDRESDIKCLSVDWKRRQALASDVAVLRLWDLDSAACLVTLRGHGSEVYAMGADWGAMLAFSGSFEGQLCIWNLQERSRIALVHEHLACVTCVSMDTNSRQALSGSNDGLLKKWDTEHIVCTMELQGGWGELRCLAVDWPGEQAISGSEVGVLKHWDLFEGVCLRRMQGETIGLFDGINSIQLDWSTANALTGGTNGQVKFWHLGEAPCFLAEHQHGPDVRCVSIDAPEPEIQEDASDEEGLPEGSEAEEAQAAATPSSPSGHPASAAATSSREAATESSHMPPRLDSATSLSQEIERRDAQAQERRRRRWLAMTSVGLVVMGAVAIALRRRWRRR